MTVRILLILLCSFYSVNVFSQELRDVSFYYAHPGISQDAKDLYAKTFDINNSSKAYSILDSVFTYNAETRPFYIYLVCTMLKNAKGELRDELNIICRYLAEQNPSALTQVLFSRNTMVKGEFKEQWAHRMGVEIRITCNSDPMFCFKKSRNVALANCMSTQKSKLELLYNLVRRDMKLFQQN